MQPVTSAQDLIARYIMADPHRRGPVEAVLRGSNISVWAIVGALWGHDFDVALVARAYEIPVEAVEAAKAYYEQHRAVIDALIQENEA